MEEPKKQIKKGWKVFWIIVFLVLLYYFFMTFQVCRSWVFICENTGSYKGYTEWFFGKKQDCGLKNQFSRIT